LLPWLAPAFLLSGCTVSLPQSMLNPAGPYAGHISTLTWQMIIVYGIVFVITLLILAAALAARKRDRTVLGSRFVVVAGIAIPTVILVFMLISDIRVSKKIDQKNDTFQVQVIGHGWWFEVRYPDYGIIDANEIHVPAGSVVRYELSAEGVVHSFWIPRLGPKRDQLPDHPNELRLVAGSPGVYYGICTEYCAGQHARMAFRLVAHAPEEFEWWLRQRQEPQPAPSDPWLLFGREVFLNRGCAECHSIQGSAQGEIGPDLTHVGSRRTLGAGQLDNTRGTLLGWISNSQALKPGNRMPRTYLPPEELHALADYLGSLK
jgi:cytochrome c oxidase subunit 2